jgi:peptidoglycan/LPS O-acetylase OafA/YrhL
MRAPLHTPLAHVPALDGLRLACCLAVVVGHAAWGPMAGRVASFGVDVFFALSGYLITSLLLREHVRLGRVDLRAFYVRRALRILPAYYASLGVAVVLTAAVPLPFTRAFHGPSDARFFTTTLASYLMLVGNWFDTPLPSTLAVLWSVCIEEQFYLLFPPTFAISTRRAPVVVPALLGLAVAWGVRVHLAAKGDGELYRNTFAHSDGLLLGALLAQATASDTSRARAWIAHNARALEIVACTASALTLTFRGGGSPLSYWESYLASAVCATAIVAAMALGHGPVARGLALRPIAWGGTLTYAGYLVHMYAVGAAFGITRRVPFGVLETPIRLAIAIAGTFALAYVAHVAVERPFLRLKARLARGGAVTPAQAFSTPAGARR